MSKSSINLCKLRLGKLATSLWGSNYVHGTENIQSAKFALLSNGWYFLLLETWPQTENCNFHYRQIAEDIFAQEKRWPLERVEFCTYETLMHGFYISRSNIIDIRPATFIMYKNAKFFALFFTWMFNLKSPDQFFISLNLFNQYQWCVVMLINFSVPRIRKPHISNSSPCRANWILTIH